MFRFSNPCSRFFKQTTEYHTVNAWVLGDTALFSWACKHGFNVPILKQGSL